MARSGRGAVDGSGDWLERNYYDPIGGLPPEADFISIDFDPSLRLPTQLRTIDGVAVDNVTVWAVGYISVGRPTAEQIAFVAGAETEGFNPYDFPGWYIYIGPVRDESLFIGTKADGLYIGSAEDSFGDYPVNPPSRFDVILRSETFEVESFAVGEWGSSAPILPIPDRSYDYVDFFTRQGTAGADVMEAGNVAEALLGLGGNDIITGSSRRDKLDGGAGNDILDGGAGVDLLIGGSGDDVFYLDNSADLPIEDIGGGFDTIVTSVGYTLRDTSEIEQIISAGNGLQLRGNILDNRITGDAGANFIDGRGGNDRFHGLGGDDRYLVDSASDVVVEEAGQGSDTVSTTVDYTLTAGSSLEILSTRDWSAATTLRLTGNALANDLFGDQGANLLDGGGGVDRLYGFGGNDKYVIDNLSDRVFETAGQGSDTIVSSVDYVLGAGVSVESLSTRDWSASTSRILTGNELANDLFGDQGANVLDGRGGVDRLYGFGGNDRLVVDNAADQVFEAAGGGRDTVLASVNYVLAAGVEVETLSTRDWSAVTSLQLTGNAIANELYGDAGGNRLDGKGGADLLYGFGGADTFAFTSVLGGSNVDRIADFASGSDKIALDDAVFTGLAAVTASNFVVGSAALDANDRIIYNNATGALLFDVDGTGSAAAVQFATLTNLAAIGANDFAII